VAESPAVVIATNDDGGRLVPTVRRLRALPEDPPVVIVDTGSPADLQALWPGDPGVTVLLAAPGAGSTARTVGLEHTDRQVVAFCDDDSWFAPGSLARAAARFAAEPRLGLLQARVLVGARQRLDPVCAQLAGAPAVLGFVACGVVVRRRALLGTGGFPPGYGFGGEERPVALDLAAAGWQLLYDASVVAHHHPAPSPRRAGRPIRAARNDLWTAWTRLPLGLAARETAGVTRARPRALAAALRGLPGALRRRRPVPSHVADAFRAVRR